MALTHQKFQGDYILKKLFTVLVFLALLTSSLFADLTFSGLTGAGATFLRMSNVNGDPMQAGNYLTGQIQVDAQSKDKTFGGTAKLTGETSTFKIDAATWNALTWTASVWWNPIPMLKFQFGIINDLALSDCVYSDFYPDDAETYVVAPYSSYVGDYFPSWTGFFGGTGDTWSGFILSLTPTEALNINLMLPYGLGVETVDSSGNITHFPAASDIYLYGQAQATFMIWDIGRIGAAFSGGGNGKLDFTPDPDDAPYDPALPIGFYQMKANASSFYGSFLFNAFEDQGLDINVGFKYTMPVEDKAKKITYNSPMEAGLGISYVTDSFGIKMRMAASFGGNVKRTGNDPMNIPKMAGLGIMPFISAGRCKIYLNAGITYKYEDEYMDGSDGNKVKKVTNSAALGWHVNPYVTATFGTATVYAGFQIDTDGLKYVYDGNTMSRLTINQVDSTGKYPGTSIIEWRIPVGIEYTF